MLGRREAQLKIQEVALQIGRGGSLVVATQVRERQLERESPSVFYPMGLKDLKVRLEAPSPGNCDRRKVSE